MDTQRPGRGRRLAFWVLGLRQPEHLRPWVAEQVVDPRFRRRRTSGVLVFQLVLVVLPQIGLALGRGGGGHLLLPLGMAVVLAAALLLARPLTPALRERTLAYYGVRADGSLREPAPWLGPNPLGRAGLAVFTAAVLVLGSGAAVAYGRVQDDDRCRPVPADQAAALTALLGVPGPVGYGPPPAVPVGSDLVAQRGVESGLDGISFVGAFVRTPGGELVGPAVWRIIEPGGVFDVDSVTVAAYEERARGLTPSAGYGTSGEDPGVQRARECAERAR